MNSSKLYKKAVIIFLTLACPFLSLAAGPGGTGGGDPREGEFVAAADKIAKNLVYIGPQFKELAP